MGAYRQGLSNQVNSGMKWRRDIRYLRPRRRSFCDAYEISSTNVSRLWDGVTFIMQARAARSLSWGCPEVATACQEQLDALPSTVLLSPPRSPKQPLHCRRRLRPPRRSTRCTSSFSSHSSESTSSFTPASTTLATPPSSRRCCTLWPLPRMDRGWCPHNRGLEWRGPYPCMPGRVAGLCPTVPISNIDRGAEVIF